MVQEYYNEVIRRVRLGLFPAVTLRDDILVCVYRGDNDKECLGGICIADIDYEENLEGKLIYDVERRVSIPEGMDIDNLAELQSLHDSMFKNWSNRKFVNQLNLLFCFRECVRVDPNEFEI